jgi:hypothetical protein
MDLAGGFDLKIDMGRQKDRVNVIFSTVRRDRVAVFALVPADGDVVVGLSSTGNCGRGPHQLLAPGPEG